MDFDVGDALLLGLGAAYGFMMVPSIYGSLAKAPKKQVIVCLSCRSANPNTNKFCGNCGRPLYPEAAVCPSCRAEIPKGWNFCGACGSRLKR